MIRKREIKFKAWLPDSKKLVNVIQINWNDDGSIFRIGYIKEIITHETCQELIYEYNENFILLQFTELKDKNGKEIYEGDIVKFGSQNGSVGIVTYIVKNATYMIKDIVIK